MAETLPIADDLKIRGKYGFRLWNGLFWVLIAGR
jgi:hypothetical protein